MANKNGGNGVGCRCQLTIFGLLTPARMPRAAGYLGAGGLRSHGCKRGERMEYNGSLERLEQKLYQRMEELVAERRYDEAEQVAKLMSAVGII